jgi:hypothetical protein
MTNEEPPIRQYQEENGARILLDVEPVRSKYSKVHETMGDVLYAPNGYGKTLRVKCVPCNVVLRPFGMLFPG